MSRTITRHPKPAQVQAQLSFHAFDAETWLARKLYLLGCSVQFLGDTDHGNRRGQVREAIAKRGCADEPLGTRPGDGRTESVREAFQRVYGEGL